MSDHSNDGRSVVTLSAAVTAILLLVVLGVLALVAFADPIP